MKALLDIARPLGSAKYVRIESFVDPAVAPAQLQSSYPWPYVEGMTITEAANDLTFLATGAYGKPLAKAKRRAVAVGRPMEIRVQVD